MKETHKILAFDTSSEKGSVALLEGVTLRAELRSNTAAGHSELLLESVDFLLGRVGWRLKDLTLIATGIGPGSFTGIRIGVATAKMLAYAAGIPVIPINSLELNAYAMLVPGQMTDDKSQMTDKGTGHKARGAGEGQIINNSNCEQYMSSENCVRAAMDSPANMSNAMSAAAGTRLWGCDVCQRVCPHNNEVVIEPPDPLARAARELIFTGDMSVLAGYIGANHARKKRLLNLAANAAGNTGDRAYLPPLQKLGQNPDYALNAQRAIEKIERGKPF